MTLIGAIQFKIVPCCPENGTEAIVNISGVLPNGDSGVYKYNGSGLAIPGTNVVFVTGACYTIAKLTSIGNVTDVPASDFTGYYLNSRCADPTVDADCPDCSPVAGNYYIKAIPCCGGDPIFFKGEGYTGQSAKQPSSLSGFSQLLPSIPQFSINNYDGVYLYDGPTSFGLEANQCYTFSFNSVSDPTSEITQAEYDLLNYPPYISQLTYVSESDCETIDPITGVKICPDCKEVCYRLTSCDGVIINTIQDFSLYVGTYIELSGYTGSWLVQVNDGICQDPSLGLKISGTGATPCPCICYEIIGESGGISYIDCDGISQYTYGPAKFCAQAPPIVKGVEGVDYTLVVGTDCVDDECVEKCFLLTNCDPTAYPEQDATIVSTLQSLSSYVATNSVVELSGYEGCWTITEAVECDCPVDVTVLRDYKDCEECLGITAYKLSNCEKINEVLYTTQDLSAFVGQVIKDDCACWTVEEIDYQPPSETTIVDPILFSDCNTCLTTYYQLDNCDLESDPQTIITSTNLAGFVGSVVQIDGCVECFTVSLYSLETEPVNSQEVVVILDFPDCVTCGTIVPRCSNVFNNTTEDQKYTFINANGDLESTDLVKSGQYSLRYCVQKWDDSVNPSGIFNFYGDCTVYEDDLGVKTGFCVQHFPNNRKVKPGYNTPICSAEKYDKITCKAADIMYKKALELRYGISNCCPEEDEKWLIKKELIELQALTDPNYECDHLTDCSCNS